MDASYTKATGMVVWVVDFMAFELVYFELGTTGADERAEAH